MTRDPRRRLHSIVPSQRRDGLQGGMIMLERQRELRRRRKRREKARKARRRTAIATAAKKTTKR